MGLQDLVEVLGGFVAVPHALGVDDHVRAELAAVETAGGVAADALDPQLPRLLAHITAQLIDTPRLRGAGTAAAARMAVRTNIRAHEDVPRVKEPRVGGGICHFL